MSRIFKVIVEVELYFHGSERPEDDELADAVKSEIEMGNAQVSGQSIDRPSQVNAEWLSTYPYGEEGDRMTIAEWLA